MIDVYRPSLASMLEPKDRRKIRFALGYGMSTHRLLDMLRLPYADQIESWENEGGSYD